MTPHIGFTPELEILPLERNGVVEEALRGIFKRFWEILFGEVKKEWIRGVGKQEGNVLARRSRENGGQSGKGIIGSGVGARDGAIGKDENSSDGIDMLLDLSCNSLRLECVLLRIASVG